MSTQQKQVYTIRFVKYYQKTHREGAIQRKIYALSKIQL
jgi:hypothetical protein